MAFTNAASVRGSSGPACPGRTKATQFFSERAKVCGFPAGRVYAGASERSDQLTGCADLGRNEAFADARVGGTNRADFFEQNIHRNQNLERRSDILPHILLNRV